MKRFLWVAFAAAILAAGNLFGQGVGYVYHGVGPVMFTNVAALGYPDGSLAGTNFYCGVYAGTDAGSLEPVFTTASGLRRLLGSNGMTVLSGDIPLALPAGTPVVMQFRVWPSEFGTYELAIASGMPSSPVGVSALWAPIPSGVIIELPIQTGPLWLTSVPEPSAVGLLALGGMAIVGRRFLRRPLR